MDDLLAYLGPEAADEPSFSAAPTTPGAALPPRTPCTPGFDMADVCFVSPVQEDPLALLATPVAFSKVFESAAPAPNARNGALKMAATARELASLDADQPMSQLFATLQRKNVSLQFCEPLAMRTWNQYHPRAEQFAALANMPAVLLEEFLERRDWLLPSVSAKATGVSAREYTTLLALNLLAGAIASGLMRFQASDVVFMPIQSAKAVSLA